MRQTFTQLPQLNIGLKKDFPVWVLNLARDSERREFMTTQLQKLGVSFELISAIDKATLSDDLLRCYSQSAALHSEGRPLSLGEISCSLSHAHMWQRMVTAQIPGVLILEDDVRLGQALFAVLANRHKFPADTEFVNFSTRAPQQPFGDFITEIYRMSHHQTYANGTRAYWLTYGGAKKLLQQVYPIRWTPDGYTGRTYLTGLVSYGIYPEVAVMANFASSIWQNSQVPKTRLRALFASRAHIYRYSINIWGNALRQVREIIKYGVLKHESTPSPGLPGSPHQSYTMRSDAMRSDAMGSDAMGSDAMGSDAMGSDAMGSEQRDE